jgi:hypothetical protein
MWKTELSTSFQVVYTGEQIEYDDSDNKVWIDDFIICNLKLNKEISFTKKLTTDFLIEFKNILMEKKDLYKEDLLLACSSSYLLATEIGLMSDRQTDVTILNSASLETAYQIIVTGTLIYECDNNLRIEYEIALKGLYFDCKPFLNTLRSQHISRLNGNTRAL